MRPCSCNITKKCVYDGGNILVEVWFERWGKESTRDEAKIDKSVALFIFFFRLPHLMLGFLLMFDVGKLCVGKRESIIGEKKIFAESSRMRIGK